MLLLLLHRTVLYTLSFVVILNFDIKCEASEMPPFDLQVVVGVHINHVTNLVHCQYCTVFCLILIS